MRWYFSKDGEVTGPVEPSVVKQWARQGQLSADWMVRDEASPAWIPIAQSPFGSYITGADEKGQPVAKARTNLRNIVLGLAAMFVLLVVIVASSDDSESSKIDREEVVQKATPTRVPLPPPPREKTLTERLAEQSSLVGALPIATQLFDNSTNELDTGSALFAIWSNSQLKWFELQSVPETKRALVMKDPVAERGKRLCVSGSIVEIQVDRSAGKPIYNGTLMTPGFHAVRYAAVGSTGELVESSAARFCGIVTGIMSYSNAGGGTTHAAYVVGMFDLAENKEPTAI